MRAISAAVATCILAAFVGSAVSGGELPQAKGSSPVQLLPGYNHRSAGGTDTEGGRIWKHNGPSIDYDIGLLAGESAKAYVDEYRGVSMVSQGGGDIAVAIDEKHQLMVVTVDHYANFRAENVRSHKDVVEVLLMANTVKRISR